MTKSLKASKDQWTDPDESPVWTEDHFRRAAIYVGRELVRPADGTWTKPGRPMSENPKKQVTLRLDPDVIENFRATGKGWQSRINAELRKALGI